MVSRWFGSRHGRWRVLALVGGLVLAAVLAAALAAALAARPAERLMPVGRVPPATAPRALGEFVLTWYSFQDNTPCNSAASASGRPLIPYVSVAVPFRLLRSRGGPLDYGDTLFVKFLEGRRMPNGARHTGWVQVDDFCGDGGDDSYCFQTVGGRRYPNVDLWVGDFTKTGVQCGDADEEYRPMGSGQERTQVVAGRPPAGRLVTDYGGARRGTGRCGDCAGARRQQSCEWHYTPTFEPWWTATCRAEEAARAAGR